MLLIIGLGNPGRQYEGTRHNVGFRVVDELSRRHEIPVERHAFRALVGSGSICGRRVLLVKPQTFMNLSGESVGAVSRYYDVAPKQIVVIVDDVALPLGTLRLRLRGSSGGHRGLESVEEHLQSRDFPRVRIGVGPAQGADLVAHVLGRFDEEELPVVRASVARAADAVEMALEQGFEMAMSRYNGPVPRDLEVTERGS